MKPDALRAPVSYAGTVHDGRLTVYANGDEVWSCDWPSAGKFTAIESLTSWLLHRFGTDSPEAREALTCIEGVKRESKAEAAKREALAAKLRDYATEVEEKPYDYVRLTLEETRDVIAALSGEPPAPPEIERQGEGYVLRGETAKRFEEAMVSMTPKQAVENALPLLEGLTRRKYPESTGLEAQIDAEPLIERQQRRLHEAMDALEWLNESGYRLAEDDRETLSGLIVQQEKQ